MAPKQQIGLLSAVAIGLASMLGAGVFSVFGPAYHAAGSALILALLLAALVAILNSATVYSLARRTSRPGGVYSYARAEWSEHASFIAGFSFVAGKIGSISAIAYTFGLYVFPSNPVIAGVMSIVILAALNALGIERTALVAAVLATITTTYLAFVGIGGSAISNANGFNLFTVSGNVDAFGVIQGAALLFFAFAGYARVATLGDEVTNPKRNIPRAIFISLSLVIVLYVLIAFALTSALGAELATKHAPFVELFAAIVPGAPAWLSILVVSGASLGSMLALLAGVSRTAATMAEDVELPSAVAKRNRFGAPFLAESIIALGSILMLVFGVQISWMVGFSSFSVLLYYAIGHATAFFSKVKQHPMQKLIQVLGFALCALLVLCVPGPAIWISSAILLVSVGVRAVARKPAGR